jgi:hypothetical protein
MHILQKNKMFSFSGDGAGANNRSSGTGIDVNSHEVSNNASRLLTPPPNFSYTLTNSRYSLPNLDPNDMEVSFTINPLHENSTCDSTRCCFNYCYLVVYQFHPVFWCDRGSNKAVTRHYKLDLRCPALSPLAKGFSCCRKDKYFTTYFP